MLTIIKKKFNNFIEEVPEKKISSKTINQIKNISQQEKIKPNLNKNEVINELKIGFESL